MKQLPRPLLFCLSLTLALLPIQAQTAAPPAATNREPAKPAMAPSVVQADYGKMPDGTPVEIFTLTNKNGAVAKIIGYGATIAELDVPDRDGKMGNVVLGADSLAAYQRFAQQAFVAGRVANRIAGAKFTLDGKEYTLNANNGPNTLHGGNVGFGKVVWKGEIIPAGKDADPAVKLTYVSKDGEEGFPGTLTTSVTYTLTAQNTLRLDYTATTDKPTPVNLTNHAFFNLTGGRGDSSGHLLMINAGNYTAADAALLPTGEIKRVKDTALDFTTPTALGARVAQLGARNYDHSFVLNRDKGTEGKLTLAARVTEPTSGRIMEVWTDQPGLQLYTSPLNAAPIATSTPANASASGSGIGTTQGTGRGRGGAARGSPGFIVLETQHFPDAVHHDNFPSIILRPGETFHTVTEYRFGAK
jgi:aldose 1-epimerase